MKYNSRIEFDVNENDAVLKVFYGDAINTTVKISHNEAVLLPHKMIKNTVVVEDAISRASSVRGRYVKTSVRMSYNINKKAIFIECFDNNGEVPMKYRINMCKTEYESTMKKLIHNIMSKNDTINNRLYLVYNSKCFPNEDIFSKLITGKASLVFSKSFSDALASLNNIKMCNIKINHINLKDKQELIWKLNKIA